jgi:hypothetical protein
VEQKTTFEKSGAKNHFLKKSGAKIFLFLLIIFYDFFIVFLLHFFLKSGKGGF